MFMGVGLCMLYVRNNSEKIADLSMTSQCWNEGGEIGRKNKASVDLQWEPLRSNDEHEKQARPILWCQTMRVDLSYRSVIACCWMSSIAYTSNIIIDANLRSKSIKFRSLKTSYRSCNIKHELSSKVVLKEVHRPNLLSCFNIWWLDWSLSQCSTHSA